MSVINKAALASILSRVLRPYKCVVLKKGEPEFEKVFPKITEEVF